MIVKVQRSQFSSDGIRRILIYDETREYQYETEDPNEISEIETAMHGAQKAFFHTELIDNEFHLSHLAEWQEW